MHRIGSGKCCAGRTVRLHRIPFRITARHQSSEGQVLPITKNSIAPGGPIAEVPVERTFRNTQPPGGRLDPEVFGAGFAKDCEAGLDPVFPPELAHHPHTVASPFQA